MYDAQFNHKMVFVILKFSITAYFLCENFSMFLIVNYLNYPNNTSILYLPIVQVEKDGLITYTADPNFGFELLAKVQALPGHPVFALVSIIEKM